MDISGLTNATTQITALSNLVVVSPQTVIGYQPKKPVGTNAEQPQALLFHLEAEQTVSLESDITDHFVEDNSAINDQIALRPETITVSGFIGELNDVPPNKYLAGLKSVADRLTTIGAYTPGLSASALLAYAYSTIDNAVSNVVSTYNSLNAAKDSIGQNIVSSDGLSGNQPTNKQQEMFQQFYGYWRNRYLFTVQTPWAVFDNMAIKSLRAVQDADSAVITNFEVTFKMIRYAKELSASNKEGRAATQTSDLINLGVSHPSPATENFQTLVG
jgi:hypothetical protein